MNLESDIEDLLNECHLTVRVNGILKLYEGIKQIKDLISEDGSFRDNPSRIPGIGKKRVEEIYYIRDWFVENYLTPQKENQSMNKYEVTIQATVTKTLLIEAKDSNSAEEAAHEQFSVLNDGPDEQYDQRTLDVTQIAITYNIDVRETNYVRFTVEAGSEGEARDLIQRRTQTPTSRSSLTFDIVKLEEREA